MTHLETGPYPPRNGLLRQYHAQPLTLTTHHDGHIGAFGQRLERSMPWISAGVALVGTAHPIDSNLRGFQASMLQRFVPGLLGTPLLVAWHTAAKDDAGQVLHIARQLPGMTQTDQMHFH